ncbi:MAG: leucine-rich repeat domain-containing protein [Bacillota bacterium]|nr:leucine-rich repeat domain-containing protein [Bacillota bacterium]
MINFKKVICVLLAFIIVSNFEGFGLLRFGASFGTSSYAQSTELDENQPIDNENIRFKDVNLDKAIREKLNKSDDEKVSLKDLQDIKELNADNRHITDLSGIELLSELDHLYLNGNNIEDISHLKGLDKLEYLEMSGNNISDISSLADFENLQFLDLSDNKITDLIPLSFLNSLTYLNLSDNQIENISFLYNLRSIKTLVLTDNKISDISVLSRLIQLKILFLNNNNITYWDIAKFSIILGRLETVYIGGNPCDLQIDILQYSNIKDTDIIKCVTNTPQTTHTPTTTPTSLATPTPISVTTTYNPSATATATPTPTSVASTCTIIPTSPLPTNSITPAPTTQSPTPTTKPTTNFSPTPIVIPSDATSNPTPTPMHYKKPIFFPDENLAKIIREKILKKEPGTVIYLEEVSSKSVLNVSNEDLSDCGPIESLQGLQYFSNLEELYLNNQRIEDITPIGYLYKLKKLYLNNNRIKSIYPLRNLTDLETLNLQYNYIDDINPLSYLSGYSNLTQLYLSNNRISEIQGLIDLTSLEVLQLDNNCVKDYSYLKKLENLRCLYLAGKDNSTDYSAIGDALIDKINDKDFTYRTPTNTALNSMVVSQTPAPSIQPTEKTIIANPAVVAVKSQNDASQNPGATVTPAATSATPTATPSALIQNVTNKPASPAFKDIDGHWAQKSLMMLFDRGILSGYPDGSMKPQLEITRAEAAVILIKALSLKPLNVKKYSFKDNNKLPAWAYGYIQKAVEMGIIKGYDDKSFKPDQKVTRNEMVSMVVRSFGFKLKKTIKLNFIDEKTIPQWSRSDIMTAVDLGIVNGYSNKTFGPFNLLTRAEAATILEKSINIFDSKKT